MVWKPEQTGQFLDFIGEDRLYPDGEDPADGRSGGQPDAAALRTLRRSGSTVTSELYLGASVGRVTDPAATAFEPRPAGRCERSFEDAMSANHRKYAPGPAADSRSAGTGG